MSGGRRTAAFLHSFRRIVNSRKLWSPKQDQAWVHDRFGEMDAHDIHGENPKINQGDHFRGRGGGPGG